VSWKYWLLALIPASLLLEFFHASPLLVFFVACFAIVPLAEWMRHATEELSLHAGSAIGGLLNVTFGNSAELILALFVLKTGRTDVVKATITGAIIGNSLIGLGLSVVIGSWRREKQTFNRDQAGLLGSLLILSVIALMIPALFDYTERGLNAARTGVLDERLSLGVSIVLILVYFANLLFTLVSHRDVFSPGEAGHPPEWSMRRSILVLLLATIGVLFEAELVSNALEATASGLQLTPFFLGIVILPFIGNAAEYFSAIYFARKDQMSLVMTIAIGSSIQVALFTAPVLVLVSFAMGHPMNLVFTNPLELIAIAGVAFAVNSIALDGETTWFEGVLLIAVYLLLALAFFFVTV